MCVASHLCKALFTTVDQIWSGQQVTVTLDLRSSQRVTLDHNGCYITVNKYEARVEFLCLEVNTVYLSQYSAIANKS